MSVTKNGYPQKNTDLNQKPNFSFKSFIQIAHLFFEQKTVPKAKDTESVIWAGFKEATTPTPKAVPWDVADAPVWGQRLSWFGWMGFV